MVKVVKALVDDPASNMYGFGDSETVLAWRERVKGYFGVFFRIRIGEMLDNEIRVQHHEDINTELYRVSNKNNEADRTARPHSVSEEVGVWLSGPAYLKLL